MSAKIRLTHEEMLVLADLAADLAARNCILRFDETEYDKWASPNKRSRKALASVADKLEAHIGKNWDWDNRFDIPDRPNFPKR